MKKISIRIILIALLATLFSCGKTTTVYQFYLIEAKDPAANYGTNTEAIFVCKSEDGCLIQETVKISELKIQTNNKKQNYTILQKTRTDDNGNPFISTSVYVLLINSEEELSAWQEWKKKWTYIEVKPVYPPGYTPQNPDKPEKE